MKRARIRRLVHVAPLYFRVCACTEKYGWLARLQSIIKRAAGPEFIFAEIGNLFTCVSGYFNQGLAMAALKDVVGNGKSLYHSPNACTCLYNDARTEWVTGLTR